MFECEDGLLIGVERLVNCDAEPIVVHHSRRVPIHRAWLKRETLVHSSDGNRTSVDEFRDWDVDRPKRPTKALVSIGQVDGTPDSIFEGKRSVSTTRKLDQLLEVLEGVRERRAY